MKFVEKWLEPASIKLGNRLKKEKKKHISSHTQIIAYVYMCGISEGEDRHRE